MRGRRGRRRRSAGATEGPAVAFTAFHHVFVPGTAQATIFHEGVHFLELLWREHIPRREQGLHMLPGLLPPQS